MRVGIDLVSVDSIREALAIHGSAYLDRVYSPEEVADCRTAAGIDPHRLAARFAAKEAAFKVLRIGDEPVTWHDVEIHRDGSSWVKVKLSLSGNAARLARTSGISELSVSVTHERGCAAAVVIAAIERTADT